MSTPAKLLPAIPAKRYFTIGEVSELCGVKAYVLRDWEQEFTQLKPMKRRGNRRYYQHHEVLLIRRIRDLLYEQGFTISGARNQLSDIAVSHAVAPPPADDGFDPEEPGDDSLDDSAPTLPMPLALARSLDGHEDALHATARDDLALVDRAQRGVGVRAAALQSPTNSAAASPAAQGELAKPGQIRTELLAIRALLVN